MHDRKGEVSASRLFFSLPKRKRKERTILIEGHFTKLLICWNIPDHKKTAWNATNQHEKVSKLEEEEGDFVLWSTTMNENIDPSEILQERKNK